MSGKDNIFIEFVRQGNAVKVTAIDPVSGLEASIVGPASAPQSILAENARRKLDYVKNKGDYILRAATHNSLIQPCCHPARRTRNCFHAGPETT